MDLNWWATWRIDQLAMEDDIELIFPLKLKSPIV